MRWRTFPMGFFCEQILKLERFSRFSVKFLIFFHSKKGQGKPNCFTSLQKSMNYWSKFFLEAEKNIFVRRLCNTVLTISLHLIFPKRLSSSNPFSASASSAYLLFEVCAAYVIAFFAFPVYQEAFCGNFFQTWFPIFLSCQFEELNTGKKIQKHSMFGTSYWSTFVICLLQFQNKKRFDGAFSERFLNRAILNYCHVFVSFSTCWNISLKMDQSPHFRKKGTPVSFSSFSWLTSEEIL